MGDTVARAVVLLMSAECAVVSLLFALSNNWKLSAYWLLVATANAILSTVK